MSRSIWTRSFLWLAVLSWGIGLGAKIFDLLVLARAWGAGTPSSLALYPYGRHWPMNPGDFFQPLSVFILVAIVGTLISGWKTKPNYRFWLLVPAVAFTLIWIATPTLFWPIITELYRVANGKAIESDTQVAILVRHWFIYDWLRVAVIATGFLSSVRAISIPYTPRAAENKTSMSQVSVQKT